MIMLHQFFFCERSYKYDLGTENRSKLLKMVEYLLYPFKELMLSVGGLRKFSYFLYFWKGGVDILVKSAIRYL